MSNLYSQKVTKADAIYAFNKALEFDKAERNDSALKYYQKNLTINKVLYGEKHQLIAMCYINIGQFYNKIGGFDLALLYSKKALELNQELFGEKHQSVLNAYTGIGFIYTSKQEPDSALQSFQKALNINMYLYGQDNPSSAFLYNTIGIIYTILRKYDSALEYQLKSVKINQNNVNADPLDIASSLQSIGGNYSAINEYNKALECYQNSIEIYRNKLGDKSHAVVELIMSIGECYIDKNDFTKALEYFQLAYNIKKEKFKENTIEFAEIYKYLGYCYGKLGENLLAVKNLQSALSILIKYYGEKHFKVAEVYYELGRYYKDKGDNALALTMLQKASSIDREVLDENNPDLANVYNNIGTIYFDNGENDLAIEYYEKALSISLKYFGEKNSQVAGYYNNLGECYREKNDNMLAFEYYNKAFVIWGKISNEHPEILAALLPNIGKSFLNIKEYNWALKYFQDAIEINKGVYGENSTQLANIYNDNGFLYYKMGNYKIALDYYQKALDINSVVLGKKHPDLARNYNNIGTIYFSQGNNLKALNYFQHGLVANLANFNENINKYSNPQIKNYSSSFVLISSLWGKEQVYYKQNNKNTALTNLQLLDTLFGQMRRYPSKISDKLLIGVTSSEVYQKAIQICLEISTNALSNIKKEDLLAQAFSFSEKNKAGVLLEALAGQESMKFVGIPDSLLQKEYKLKVNTSLYEKDLAESSDSINYNKNRDQLFKLNSQYNDLIAKFEKEYPDYYNLKYAVHNPTIKEIQNIIDSKTAIRSYFVGDSSIFIFTLTNKRLDVKQVPIIKNLNDSITWFRHGLTNTSPRMQENYRRIGFLLYKQLFPQSAPIDKQIENLVIIPDGSLATLPFESLLTSSFKVDINAYKEYPFLIKKYNISYSYSANLFYRTFSKRKAPSIEITKLNDWLAFAPVFDNTGDQTLVLSTRELQKQLKWLKTDSLMTNRSILDRNYITPLPATETETEAIFKIYDEKNLKAKVLLHNNATEQFVKSGELAKYKALHFATHGFVNSERPELSGLLLAQDTTGGEDGVLYSGEIYNLKLNADLVVLSACETGLGQIQKGEGIIGLTRALLYAGAKNIIVSLWQVEDESTSDLMVDFYKNSIESKGKVLYSEALRNAKLKMINEGKYAHPLYWSPFILIGK